MRRNPAFLCMVLLFSCNHKYSLIDGECRRIDCLRVKTAVMTYDMTISVPCHSIYEIANNNMYLVDTTKHDNADCCHLMQTGVVSYEFLNCK